MLIFALALAATSTTTATTTTAVDAPSEDALLEKERTTAYALIGAAYNPDALALFLGFEKKYTYDKAPGVLWRELYTQFGAELLITAMFRPAVFAEWSPIRIFKLRLQYDLWFWPGFHMGRGHGLVFPTKEAPFNQEELERREGEEVSGVGHRLSLAPTLQAKVWRFVLVNTFEVAGWYVHGAEAFWREPLHDTLVARGKPDATFKNTTVVGFEVWTGGKDERVIAGGTFEIIRALEGDVTRQRIGGVVLATPFESLGAFDRPALFLLGGVNLKDRNREDEPWITVGLRLDVDVARR